jgi:two-component system CheB/CheR fusion protein
MSNLSQNENDENHGLDELLEYIRLQRGFDFTGYKKASLGRRIQKRLQARHVETYADYRGLLEADPDEFVELFNTILINVTSFFRDEFAWSYVGEEIIPRLFAQRGEEAIRVWSAGCATGEEAFSLAMLLAEALGEEDFKARVKVYATDVDEDALSFGRHATFSTKQVNTVPPDLLERYFTRENHSYVFRSDLRRAVIFGRHNLVQDPPISRIDLLASRNTLMYFQPETQAQILSSFHFALRPDGFLFLGKSEALTAKTDLFTPVDLKRRVFAKVAKQDTLTRPRIDPQERVLISHPTPEVAVREAGLDHVPVAFVVVDFEGRLVLANLQARVYFGLAQRDVGRPIQDLEISFRPLELRSRLEQAYRERHAVTVREVEWRQGEEIRFLDIQLTPLTGKNSELIGCGVSFTDVSRYRRLQVALQDAKREAETAYEELQSTVEELETTNEELQATNEELETTNEELQATNEELETTNEELQATNEELETMNDELHQRGLDLNSANLYLEAILTSLRAAVIVVDNELRVQAWNAGARDLWGLTGDEAVGQHLLNLDIGLPVEELRGSLRATFADNDVDAIVVDAVNRRGRRVHCTVSLTPLGSDGDISGVILMMQAEEARIDGA